MESVCRNILLVIPVYNHDSTLRAVVEKGLDAGFPVLVVDDGSTDRGLAVVEDLPVLRHRFPSNLGKGAAILAAAGIAKRSGFDTIITIDADGQHDPSDARLLAEAAAGTRPEIVVGARRMDEGLAPKSSVFGRNFSNFWVRLESGRSLPDSQSGFRLYPVDFLLAGKFLSTGFAFEVEVLVRAAWAGVQIRSVPVSVRYPPPAERVSHFRPLVDNLRLSFLHAWLVTRSLLPWPHRRFLPQKEEGRSDGPMHPVRFFQRLSREHSGAGELAAAVWVGIFVGALPIIPFGLAAIVYVTHRLHLNKLAGMAASNVCCAPFVPLACVQTGHFLRHGRFLLSLDRSVLLGEIHLRLYEWLLGALVIGPVLGALGAGITYLAIRSLRAGRPVGGHRVEG